MQRKSRVAKFAELLMDRRDGYFLRRIEKVECSRKTLQAMLVDGMSFLVGGRNRTAIRIVQAELGERNIVKGAGLRELGTSNRQQQRLHEQGIDRGCADQPSPERSRFRTCLISSGGHAQGRVVLGRLAVSI
jgi:hypothetical protein